MINSRGLGLGSSSNQLKENSQTSMVIEMQDLSSKQKKKSNA
jgi:hypothetical protein